MPSSPSPSPDARENVRRYVEAWAPETPDSQMINQSDRGDRVTLGDLRALAAGAPDQQIPAMIRKLREDAPCLSKFWAIRRIADVLEEMERKR